jgi:hypothetical protein
LLLKRSEIIQLFVAPSTLQVTPDFRVRYAWFASPHAARLVLEALEAEKHSDLRDFLVASGSHPPMASLRGVLFEQYSHNVVLQGGISCAMRQLRPSRRRPNRTDTTEYDEAKLLLEVDNEPESHHEVVDGGQQQQQQAQLSGGPTSGMQVGAFL